ncbi:hypothetical protein SAMN05660464_0752 [Geodermatophilus dictyosporus]|uniref:STAS domain-containing protein n=1 Tax=Geodermatophilus dictyosporus TaxID=1523247 RepID=A0A1I5JHE7_9ACTN|nr:hypothetical protein [Geodermatophilus dictyosporus]SFO72185.1 hypothetical protein SAMN05660464_0752 [Geodermatophilus dictyosporus]
MTSPTDGLRAAWGVVRLLNTSGGGVLCLAGAVDGAAVASFHRRYGREPAHVAVIDARSVTSLSPPVVELLVEHLVAGYRAGRPVLLRRSAPVERALAGVI